MEFFLQKPILWRSRRYWFKLEMLFVFKMKLGSKQVSLNQIDKTKNTSQIKCKQMLAQNTGSPTSTYHKTLSKHNINKDYFSTWSI